MHILTIFMLRTNCETVNTDYVKYQLLNLLKNTSVIFGFMSPQPFDLINLSIDVMLKQNFPLKTNHHLGLPILNSMVSIAQNVLAVLDSCPSYDDSWDKSLFDIWFKVLRAI